MIDLWASTSTVTVPDLLEKADKKEKLAVKDFTGREKLLTKMLSLMVKYWSNRKMETKPASPFPCE